MMSNSDTEDGLAVLQSFIGQHSSSIAHASARSNTLDMQIGRDMQVLISRQLVDQRLDIMERVVGCSPAWMTPS